MGRELKKIKNRDLRKLNKNPNEFWKGVTYIGEHAFEDCISLERIEIPEGVEEIGEDAFSSCSKLKEIKLPNSLKIIDDNVFAGCTSLERIEIPEGVEEIGYGAFEGCSNLKEIKLPNSLKTIDGWAFNNCISLERIEIPEGVEVIGVWAFCGCSKLKEIKLPKDLKTINDKAFGYCTNLERIEIPEGVESIGVEAFSVCSKLKEIKLPKSLKTIGKNAFNDCTGIKCLSLSKNNEVYLASEIDESRENCEIFKVFPGIDVGFVVENKEELSNVIKRINQLDKMGVVIPKNLINDNNSFKDFLYNKDYKVMRNLIKMMPEECKKFNLLELYKLANAMGVLENPSVTIKVNGKEVSVRDVAYTVLQGAFNQGYLKFDELHSRFSSMKLGNYNEEFLKFMSNKTNLSELSQEDALQAGFTSRVYDWFEDRKKLDMNDEDNDIDLPISEENRYKIQTYETVENGTDRVKWKSPTVSLLKKEFVNKKFTGMTDQRSREIGEYLSDFNLYEQKHFNKALEIDKERIESGVADHLTKKIVKEDVIDSLEDYKRRTSAVRNEIIDELSETSKNQTDTASKIFTYEMLAKSDKANFAMGFLTSCCATLYNAGAGAQRAMILHKDMQPLVIKDIRGNIVAFGIVYVNREEGYAVVNDFEVNKKYLGKDEQRKEIYAKAMQGVEAFVTEYNKENSDKPIKIVTCGVSPNVRESQNWVVINDFIRENPRSEILKAPNFNDFKYVGSGTWEGDWHREQYVIWDSRVKKGDKR